MDFQIVLILSRISSAPQEKDCKKNCCHLYFEESYVPATIVVLNPYNKLNIKKKKIKPFLFVEIKITPKTQALTEPNKI